MTPPLEKSPERHFVVHLVGEDGALAETIIRADTACEPKKAIDKWMVFKRDGEVVGKVHVHRLAAWHVRDEPEEEQ